MVEREASIVIDEAWKYSVEELLRFLRKGTVPKEKSQVLPQEDEGEEKE